MTSRRMRFILLGGLIVLLISLWANSQSPSPRSTPPKGVTPTAPSADKLQAVPPMRLTQQDIGDVFLIITDLTGWNIIPTTEVSRAKVSLWTNSITPDELLDQVVKLAGFVHHREGNTISVMTYDEYIQHYGVAKKVMGMKYAKADSVAEVIKPFLTKLGKIVVHKETHTLVLYEVPANLETLVGIVQELDTPTENITIEVVGLKYTDAQDLAQILEKAFTDSKRTERNRSSPIGNPGYPSSDGGTGRSCGHLALRPHGRLCGPPRQPIGHRGNQRGHPEGPRPDQAGGYTQ